MSPPSDSSNIIRGEWTSLNPEVFTQSKPGRLMRFILAIRVKLLVRLMRIGSRLSIARIAGFTLRLHVGGCNPAPLPGLSFEPFFRAGVEDLDSKDVVLDMGSGSGVWALFALQKGAQVTASDLNHVSLDHILTNAQDNDLPIPEVCAGDLFEPHASRAFDRILFNPPFHIGLPDRRSDMAYVGGSDGGVLKRFLAELAQYLTPNGTACIILPAIEITHYAQALTEFEIKYRTYRWIPLLGTVYLLELRTR